MEIYEPSEDTFLILEQIKDYAHGNVLDMGTGSGVLALEAAKIADFVVGVDVNAKAIEYAKQKADFASVSNVRFVESDLFSYFKQNPMKFDLIIFNPPYLPEDEREPFESRVMTTGGKKGYELLEKFFSRADEHLESNGKILVLFSTLTGKDKVHSIIENYGFSFQKIAEESLFGEILFVYVVERSDFLNSLDGITNIKKLTQGHRGEIYTGRLDGAKITIKKQREDTAAIERITNEARWLKVLNRKGIGPQILYLGDNYFIYKFVEGMMFPKFMLEKGKGAIKKVLIDVFKQCFIMDSMMVNKEEMHNPYKHIIIKDSKTTLIDAEKSEIKKISSISKTPKVVLIDFERMHTTISPKNITQFCQYITKKNVLKILKEKGFKFTKAKVTSLAKKYKKDMSEDNFKAIIGLLN